MHIGLGWVFASGVANCAEARPRLALPHASPSDPRRHPAPLRPLQPRCRGAGRRATAAGVRPVGITEDDVIPEDVEAQAALCFRAIRACLAEAGMGPGDIVRLNAYVTDRAYLRLHGGARSASSSIRRRPRR